MDDRNLSVAASNTESKSNEEFLEHKTKKKWMNGSGHNCFLFYPRAMRITWGNHERFWDWKCFKEVSDENIEVIKINEVWWLDVKGRCMISDLSPEVDYEIACEVKLKNGAYGWGLPITLELSLPNHDSFRQRQVSLLDKPRGEWIELNFGSFRAGGYGGEVCFHLYERGSHRKTGLVIKSAIIRPKGT